MIIIVSVIAVVDMKINKPFLFATLLFFAPIYELASIEWSHVAVTEERSSALLGYDPVAYFKGAAKEGEKHIRSIHKGNTYLFSSHTNRLLFIKNPEKYLPACGGFCAYGMVQGAKIHPDPENFKQINGKTYLFYRSFRTDARRIWERKSLEISEEKMVMLAEKRFASLGN